MSQKGAKSRSGFQPDAVTSSTQRKAGALLSYASLIVNAAVSFFYVPILLSALTTAEYGVYELIGSMIAYLSVMDMGLSTTLNRFYVKTRVSEGQEATENLLAVAAIVYAMLTVLAVVLGFVLDSLLEPVFGASFSASDVSLAHEMMKLVILNCAVVLPGNWFLALINANERFIFARSLSIVKYLLQVIVVLLVLNWHAGVMGVLIVQVALNIASVVLYMLYCKTRLHVKAKLHHWDWPLVGSLFAFSFFILLNMVFDQVFWKTGQVVLGAVCGVEAVAVYGIVCKVVSTGFVQISTGVTSVFLPKLTAISAATDDMSEVNELFCRIGRVQAILVWGFFAGFVALGREFVFLWAGPDFVEAYPAIVALMAGLLIPLTENLGISVLQAKNKMGFRSIVYTVFAIVYLVVSIPASSAFGVMGCAVTAAVVLFVQNGPVINWYYHYKIGIDIPAFCRSILPLIVPALIACILTVAFHSFLFQEITWTAVLLGALVFCAGYFGLLWLFWLNDYEKGLVKNAFQKIVVMRRLT